VQNDEEEKKKKKQRNFYEILLTHISGMA